MPVRYDVEAKEVTRPNGHITVTVRTGPLGREAVRFGWQGGDVVAISRNLLNDASGGIFTTREPRPGEVFWCGPFLLRCLDYRFLADEVVACRERPVIAQARYAWHRSTALLDLAYRRLVITLAVWRLARYEQNRIPSWRDVYALAPLVRWSDQRQSARIRRIVERINRSLSE